MWPILATKFQHISKALFFHFSRLCNSPFFQLFVPDNTYFCNLLYLEPMHKKKYYLHRILWTLLFIFVLDLSAYAQKHKSFTVVIDAGHGGKDTGTIGSGIREKDVNLAVALRVGKLIKSRHSDVKVLYTRDKDCFVTLMGRAEFANKNNADLFISIHANSQERGSSGHGTETFVMGQKRNNKNMAVVQRENSVILMEDDYKTVYKGFDPRSTESYIMFELMQNAHQTQSIKLAQEIQKGFAKRGRHDRGVKLGNLAVLVFSAMPSVLIELGFLSNPSEARYLKSESGRNELAQAIAQGFDRYKEDYDRRSGNKVAITQTAHNEEKKGETVLQANNSEEKRETQNTTTSRTYKIQILSAKKNIKAGDRQLKGYKVTTEKKGNRYFFLTGFASSEKEAHKLRRKIKKHFPDAFIVVYENGKRVKEIY